MTEEEFLANAHIAEQQTIQLQPLQAEGLILDIGGGGEGIIGKLHGSQVVAIDKNLRELEETSNDALKIVMDATDLKFLDAAFDTATAFYTLMYVPNSDITKVLSETHRVLRPGGRLHVWDAVIPAAVEDKIYYCLPLRVVLPDETIETGYGVKLKEQTPRTIREAAEEAGFKTLREESTETTFRLELER